MLIGLAPPSHRGGWWHDECLGRIVKLLLALVLYYFGQERRRGLSHLLFVYSPFVSYLYDLELRICFSVDLKTNYLCTTARCFTGMNI